MKPRFSENQPWNFGFKPSDYYRTLSPEQRAKVQLPNVTLEELDDLHALTLNSPETRTVVLDDLMDLIVGGYIQELIIPNLLITHCKPFGEFELYERYIEIVLQKLDEFGIHYSDPKQADHADAGFHAGFSPQIVQVFEQYRDRKKSDKVTKQEWDLIRGILYGYPIGDVFSWTFEYMDHNHQQLTPNHGIFYKSFPAGWSRKWSETVGDRAAEHLKRVYYQSITKPGSFERTRLPTFFQDN